MWTIFKTITSSKSKKQTLADLVWTYGFKKLPAHDFALFERANYFIIVSEIRGINVYGHL